MVAYSFQPRFAPLIREGVKRQTVRGYRDRHARPGEYLQLFTGLRTASATKIVEDPVCTEVLPVRIGFASGRIARIEVAGMPVLSLDGFAAADGFESLDDMTAFWLERHGAKDFEGVVIEWAMPRWRGGRPG
mgnify:CR=1 FL=1